MSKLSGFKNKVIDILEDIKEDKVQPENDEDQLLEGSIVFSQCQEQIFDNFMDDTSKMLQELETLEQQQFGEYIEEVN